MISVVLVLTLTSLAVCHGEKWAVLVAGSEGYNNYRHQADVCHAYQILRSHGVPASNIITLMKDDIAYHADNPYKGTIINVAGGPDVYSGVTIDYSGNDLSPSLFYRVLKGDSAGVRSLLGRDGKVLYSGPNDQVFFYYSDHGGVGVLALNHQGIFANDLNDVITYLSRNGKYGEMLIYIEACYSGSLFSHGKLPSNTKIYATTAANPTESSYSCCWDSSRSAWVGDEYSSNWMRDSDTQNLNARTVGQQFDYTKQQTRWSHTMQYGDTSLKAKTVGEFQGSSSSQANQRVNHHNRERNDRINRNSRDVIRSDLVDMDILQKKIAAAASTDQANGLRNELHALIQRNNNTNTFFQNMVKHTTDEITYESLMDTPVNVQDYDCHHAATKLIFSMCPGMSLASNYEALKNLKVLANLCETGVPQERVMAAIARSARTNDLC